MDRPSHIPIASLSDYEHEIRETVWRFTGIPVSLGIATTKTLSKVATEIVKKQPLYHGVLSLVQSSNEELDELLENLPVQDLWGIGSRYSLLLQSKDIFTARDLKYANQRWIRKHLTVVGERTVLELRGVACIPPLYLLAIDSRSSRNYDSTIQHRFKSPVSRSSPQWYRYWIRCFPG